MRLKHSFLNVLLLVLFTVPPCRPAVALHAFFADEDINQPAFQSGDDSLLFQPQDPPYIVRQFGVNEGLPQNSVNDILQTSDGFLWIATFAGLARFDGHTFNVYNRANAPGLVIDRILSLYEDSEGAIWIFPESAQTMLIRYYENRFESFVIREDEMAVSPVTLLTDPYGQLWLSAFDTIYLFRNNTFEEIPITEDPLSTVDELNQTAGLWISTDRKLIRTVGEKALLFADLSEVLTSSLSDVIPHPNFPDALMLTSTGGGILTYRNGTIEPVETSSEIETTSFHFFQNLSDRLLVFFYGSAAVWEDDRFTTFQPFEPELGHPFSSVVADQEGNLWIGTLTSGLFQLKPAAISMIGREQGMENEQMLSLTQLQDSTKLFGTNCGGIYAWKEGRLWFPGLNEETRIACAWAIFQDSAGTIWFGNRGIYRTEDIEEKPELFMEGEWFNNVEIFAFTEDSNGALWVGTANGLLKFEEDSFTHFTMEDGLYFNDARALFEDEDGVLWVGTKAGLNTITNGSVDRIPLIGASAESNHITQPYIRAFHKDETGALWIGTYGEGLFRLKEGGISHITSAHGLFDDIVSHLIEDDSGYFWMGSNRGISKVSKRELQQLADGGMTRVRNISFGTGDGMKSAETNGGFQPSVIMDDDGRLYFPTIEGVAIIETSSVRQNLIPPPVKIVQLRTVDSLYVSPAEIRISHDNPFLEIDYTALSFSDPERVHFQYRLAGLDDTWIDAGNSRRALFSKIQPGSYRFEVIAGNHHGAWNMEGASIGLIVTPPFWQTWWFYTLLFCLFILSGPAIYYYRVSRLERENERQRSFSEKLLESQESERRRIASELHDGLGQQILVIKNRAAMALMQPDNREALLSELEEISQSAQSSIDSVREISYGLRPVHLEKFGLTEALNSLFTEIKEIHAISWRIEIEALDRFIPQEKEIHFYRVIQEACSNILKHSEASEASIVMKKGGKMLTVLIEDNGKGFDPGTFEESKGLGTAGMRERITTLGGMISIQSQPAGGTKITIEIPVTSNGKS